MFYPDGKENAALMEAWQEFYRQYGENILRGWNAVRVYTVDAAVEEVSKEIESSVSDAFSLSMDSKSFSDMEESAQAMAKQIIAGITSVLSGSDWSEYGGGEKASEAIKNEALAMAEGAWAGYQKIYDEIKRGAEQFQLTDNKSEQLLNGVEQFRIKLGKEIAAFNELYGTSFSFDDFWNMFIPQTENGEDPQKKAEELDAALQALYDQIKAGSAEFLIAQASAKGWKQEMSYILDLLNSGDYERILSSFAYMKTNSEATYKQFTKDFDWFEHFLNLLHNGQTQAAIDLFNQKMAEASTSAADLKKEMKQLAEENALQELKDNKFASWITEISDLIKNQDGLGLYTWLVGKDEKSRDAFFEMYPLAVSFFDMIAQSEGNVALSPEQWIEYAAAIRTATDSYEAWDKKKRDAAKSSVSDDEGLSAAKKMLSSYYEDGIASIEDFSTVERKLTTDELDWLEKKSSAYKTLREKISEGTATVEDLTRAMLELKAESLGWELEELEEAGKVLSDFPGWVEDAALGGMDLEKACAKAGTAMETMVQANAAYDMLANKTYTSTKEQTKALNVLASATGYSAEYLRGDLAPAQQYLASQASVTTASMQFLVNTLQATGKVNFNSSGWRTELALLASQADTTEGRLARLLQTMISVSNTSINSGKVSIFGAITGAISSLFNPNGKNTTSKGSGGGGGGSSRKNQKIQNTNPTEITRMVDIMKQIQDIRDHEMSLLDEKTNYFDQRGELQGVILYYKKQKEAIEENSATLEENIRKIESLLPAKQAEVAAMDVADENYKRASSDLESLQNAHQEYTLQLLENKTKVEELTESIKEQNDKIRDMEIELRETIYKAIEDREDLNERILEGTIKVEDEILDVIKSRYEKEEQAALDTANSKIEALEKERDLLDEQFNARKKLAEKEDKQLKLTQLQLQLSRISADPTRRKEALELEKQIAELRDEMAWDLAEEEVEAQKESIDQQITSLEDYADYVEKYYEDLFENPKKLIEEMQSIISKTDAEILSFLKTNSDEYASATEATRQSIINGWQEMLDDMRGTTKTYWDEVDQIIAGGDDAILQFLKDNSADYREAGKLQAEAYVDEWKTQLEDLKNAHKSIADDIAKTYYDTIRLPDDYESSSSSSGGSSGSSSSNKNNGTSSSSSSGTGSGMSLLDMLKDSFNKVIDSYNKSKGWWVLVNGNKVSGPYSTEENAKLRMNSMKRSGDYQSTDKFTVKKYAKGGIADSTGLAWIDGTKQNPERILSPTQTKLFEALVSSLEAIRVQTPRIPSNIYEGKELAGASTFGDIIVQVNSLSSDTDFEEMAEKIMDVMSRKIAKGTAVGGIRRTR